MAVDFFVGIERYRASAASSGIIMTVLTTIALVLRLLSKVTTKQKMFLDDWVLITAQCLWYLQYGFQVKAMVVATKISSATDPLMLEYLKWVYICGEFYFPVVFFTNLSILLLYRRIFSTPAFRIVTNWLMGLNLVWFIPGLIAESLMCIPFDTMWTDPTKAPTNCINYGVYFVIICSFELIIDAIILVLPILEVTKLQMPLKTKLALSFIFLLGFFTIGTGIPRIVLGYYPGEQWIDVVADIMWLNLHCGTALLCACLPTYRPLVKAVASTISNTYKRYYGSGGRSSRGYDSSQNKNGYKSFGDSSNRALDSRSADLHDDDVNLVNVEAKTSHYLNPSHQRNISQGINVQRTVDITR